MGVYIALGIAITLVLFGLFNPLEGFIIWAVLSVLIELCIVNPITFH
tara:strand:+ start:1105 stop:1245 length:141 start_codon:yes stop_codon:yes gene_type:complete